MRHPPPPGGVRISPPSWPSSAIPRSPPRACSPSTAGAGSSGTQVTPPRLVPPAGDCGPPASDADDGGLGRVGYRGRHRRGARAPRHGRAPGAGAPVTGQVLAANVELVLVVEPLPEPNERRSERIVSLAPTGGVPAALVLTKADLVKTAATCARTMARGSGSPTGSRSASTTGIVVPLTALLEPGRRASCSGPSGAGKSTLVNALLGYERQAIGAVRRAQRRARPPHTVTRDLLTLPRRGAADRHARDPRGRAVGGRRRPDLPDIEELAAQCRFSDCPHSEEPGCAVRAEGDPARVAAWQKLQREQAWVDDRRAATRRREQRGALIKTIRRAALSGPLPYPELPLTTAGAHRRTTTRLACAVALRRPPAHDPRRRRSTARADSRASR